MKIKESNLVIGDEYYFDNSKTDRGIFVGVFDKNICFYPMVHSQYNSLVDGTIPFRVKGYEYEEV